MSEEDPKAGATEATDEAAVTVVPEASDQPKATSGGQIEAARPRASTPGSLDFVLDVPLHVRVEIGSASLRVGEVLQLDKGSVIELDRMAGDPADVLVNGRLVAKGEITVVDERLGVRLLEISGRGPASGDT